MEGNRSIEEICDDLSNNFLFQASLGSKELFHSNMLAWLLEQPNIDGKLAALELFGKIVLEIDSFPKIDFSKNVDEELYSIKREENKIDLTIRWKENETSKYIYIENKMKSIPTIEQLIEYNDKIKDENNFKLILTPFESTKSKEFKEIDWINITYEKHIITFLEECKKIKFFKDEDKEKKVRIIMFIDLYVGLIRNTLEICKKLNINDENKLRAIPLYYFYDNSNIELRKIKKIRFNDFILKLVHEIIAKIIKQNLKAGDKEIIRGDFSRAEGITDVKISVHQEESFNQYIILQLQGLNLRYGTEVIFNKKKKKEKDNTNWNKLIPEETNRNIRFAKILYEKKLWFFEDRNNKTLLKGNGKSPTLKIESAEKNAFNSFTNDTFIYMNRKIDSFRMKNISEWINLIVDEAQYVINEINKGVESQILKIYNDCKN